MADKEQISLLSQIRDELSHLNQGQQETEKSQDNLEAEFKHLGRAYSAAIAAGDSQAQQQLKETRAAIQQQMRMNDYLSVAEEMAARQNQNNEETEENTSPEEQKKTFVDSFKEFFGRDFKEKFFETFESLKTSFGEGLGKFKEGLKSTAEDAGSFFLTIAKIIGGLVVVQGFLNGLLKSTEWFGENAGFGEKLASIFAGIIGSFTGMTDEEMKSLAVSINETFDSIAEVIGKIKDVMVGIFGEKGALAVTLFLVFGGALRNMLLKGVFVAAKTLITTVGSALTSLLTPVVVAMKGFFTGIITTLSPMIAAAAPFIAVGAAIAAGLYALYEAGKEALTIFDETGSFSEGLSAFTGKLLGLPFDLLKDFVSWVAGALGFENFSKKLDSISIADEITNIIANGFNFVKIKFMEMVNSITGWWDSFITGDSLAAQAMRKLGIGGDAMEAKEARESLPAEQRRLTMMEEQLVANRNAGVTEEDNAKLIEEIERSRVRIEEKKTLVAENGPTFDIEAEKAEMRENRRKVEELQQARLEAKNKESEVEEAKENKKAAAMSVNTNAISTQVNNSTQMISPMKRPSMGYSRDSFQLAR